MAQSHIIAKLDPLLYHGITTEAQAVYLMVGVRKLLEQQPAKEDDEYRQYEYLKFHCDWALHSKLDRGMAQRILRLFDAANLELKAGGELKNLPSHQHREIEFISKMTYFERELTRFLETNGLPSLDTNRSDGFAHFLHLYAKVIEDCPLVMTGKNEAASIASVTIRVILGKMPQHSGDMWFRVNWTILDKNGRLGNLYVDNSFSLNPNATPAPG
jgi:hypothetical protein